MAKRPPITLIRTPHGLVGATAYDDERICEYGMGAEVEATVRQRRSGPLQRKYWVTLSELWHNEAADKYNSSEDMHRVLMIDRGYTRHIKLLVPSPRAEKVSIVIKVINLLRRFAPRSPWLQKRIDESIETVKEFETDCQEITLPGSTAYDAMDNAEFKIYFDGAMQSLTNAGYDMDVYLKASEKKLATRPTSQSSPYHKEVKNGLRQGQTTT